jgi:hypothetical protein
MVGSSPAIAYMLLNLKSFSLAFLKEEEWFAKNKW